MRDRWISRFLCDEGGATSIEYAAIAMAISLVLFATVPLIGNQVAAMFQALSSAL